MAACVPGTGFALEHRNASLAGLPPAPTEEATPWAGSIALGFIRTTSSSKNTTLNFSTELLYNRERWSNRLAAKATYTRKDHSTSDQSWQLSDQVRRNLTERTYTFASFNYVNDRFAGITQRMSETVGYGRMWLDTEHQTLDIGVGAGIGHERKYGTRSWSTQPLGMLIGSYGLSISDTAEFKQALLIESGTNNTYINPVTSLKLRAAKNIFVSLEHEMRHNTHTPPGSRRTDTITTVNLGYDFGQF